jgi:hypothetical protein
MTAILGSACLVLLLISTCSYRVFSWAVLLSLTWVAGFAEPWTYPVMNGLALLSAIALISTNKEACTGFAGLVTMIFPVMLALDLTYSFIGEGVAWFYYWSLIWLFALQLFAVSWMAAICWRDRFRHLRRRIHFHAFRVSGRHECQAQP